MYVCVSVSQSAVVFWEDVPESPELLVPPVFLGEYPHISLAGCVGVLVCVWAGTYMYVLGVSPVCIYAKQKTV